ncbi:MAG: hypothetical protein H6700_08590 [Myxococcales bacterium]|nr:hypothetical protein [Myxococcales bacterium]MCB9520081.1 hypothetical protein [Myxococcales bacterium]MCB9531807.1 hypothetical protein [Myxococcales bacterium]
MSWRPTTPPAGGWLAILVCVTIAYLGVAPYYDRLNNPNENVRVYMTRSIVEDHTFAIDDVIDEWGYVNDKATHDGHMYPGKAPGVSYLGVPAYFAYYHLSQLAGRDIRRQEAVMVCRLGGAILPTLLLLLAVAAFFETVPGTPATRRLGFVAIALGSTVTSYGGLFASHSTMALSLFCGFAAVRLHERSPRSYWPPFAIGTALGWAIALEYPALLGALAVGGYALWRSRSRDRLIIGVILGGLIPGALVVLYHTAAFGGPLETPYSHLENPEFVRHMSGFFGMERVRMAALNGSFFAASNGLFWFAPWTILPAVGLVLGTQFRRLREPAALTAAILVAYTLFIATLHNWRGGWTAGPRYIVGVIPFLGWYLSLLLNELRRSTLGVVVRAVALALVAVGMFNCGLAAATFPHYPEQIENPVFEVSLYFLARGYVPYSPLGELGVPGLWALLPVLAAYVGALAALVMSVDDVRSTDRAPLAAAAAALAALFIQAQSLPETTSTSLLSASRQVVATVWEPLPPLADALARGPRLPLDVTRGTATPELLTEVGRATAARGMDDAAIALFERANRAQPEDAPPSEQPAPTDGSRE